MSARLAALTASLVLGCAGSTPLPPDYARSSLPVGAPKASSDTVGKCLLKSSTNSITIDSCPPELASLFVAPHEATVSEYSYGVLTFKAGTFLPTVLGAADVGYFHETKVESSLTINVSDEVPSDDELEALQNLCDHQVSSEVRGVVTTAYQGCSVSKLEATLDVKAAVWNMSMLAKNGTVAGKPQGFWYQSPTSTDPPKDPRCLEKRAVWIDVMDLSTICSTLLTSMRLRHLEKRIHDSEGELTKKSEQLTKAMGDLSNNEIERAKAEGELKEVKQSLAHAQALNESLAKAVAAQAPAVAAVEKVPGP